MVCSGDRRRPRRGPLRPKNRTERQCNRCSCPLRLRRALPARLCRTGPFEPFLACVFTGAPLSRFDGSQRSNHASAASSTSTSASSCPALAAPNLRCRRLSKPCPSKQQPISKILFVRVMAQRSKSEKLAEARAASDQPFRATDSEFGALKLREGFVAAQVTCHPVFCPFVPPR